MKDLKFSGKLQSKNAGAGDMFTVGLTFRTDLIATHENANFTVLSTQLDYSTLKEHHEEWFGNNFRQLPYNLKAFKDFATTNGLTLTIKDSTGDNKETLVDGESSSSL